MEEFIGRMNGRTFLFKGLYEIANTCAGEDK